MLGLQTTPTAYLAPLSDTLAQLIYSSATYSQVALTLLINHTLLGIKSTLAVFSIQLSLLVLLL